MKHLDNVPKEINNWKVYGLATVACMAAVMIGYDVSCDLSCQSQGPYSLNHR